MPRTKQYIDQKQKFDTNFQGYGRFLTSSTGEFYFRTIKPVPYRGRPAAHIHARVWKGDKKLLTTECFVKGYEGNEKTVSTSRSAPAIRRDMSRSA